MPGTCFKFCNTFVGFTFVLPKYSEIPGGSPGGRHLPVLRGGAPGGAQRPRAAPQRGRHGDPQRDQGAGTNDRWGQEGVIVITNDWLVVWNIFYFFNILGIIIPIDYGIFQRA